MAYHLFIGGPLNADHRDLSEPPPPFFDVPVRTSTREGYVKFRYELLTVRFGHLIARIYKLEDISMDLFWEEIVAYLEEPNEHPKTSA